MQIHKNSAVTVIFNKRSVVNLVIFKPQVSAICALVCKNTSIVPSVQQGRFSLNKKDVHYHDSPHGSLP